MRVNLSVAIVAMVNSTYVDAKASAKNPKCQRDEAENHQGEGEIGGPWCDLVKKKGES